MRTAPGRHVLAPSTVIREPVRLTLMTGCVTAVWPAEAAVLPAATAVTSASAAIVSGKRVLWMVRILLPPRLSGSDRRLGMCRCRVLGRGGESESTARGKWSSAGRRMRPVVGRATVVTVKLAVREIVVDERARRAADVLLAAAITVTSLVGVLAPVITAGRRQGPIEVFAALVIAAYSVGAHVGGRRERLGLAVLVAPQALAGGIVVASGHAGPGDFFFPTLLSLVAAWIVGRIIRGRRERTLELEAL